MELSNRPDAGLPLSRLQWEIDDEALAYYVATARYGGRTLPASVQEEMERIALAAASDPVLAARLERLSRRMDELDSNSASESLELLTGIVLPERSERPRRDRDPVRALWRGKLWRSGIVVVLPVAAALYLVLAVSMSAPTYADLASLDPERTQTQESLVLRGRSAVEEEAAHVRYQYARSLLTEADGRWFGLFRRFDRTKVVEAIELLQQARAASHADAPVHAASSYALAKAYLALEEVELARRALGEAAAGRDPYASAASELQARLDARLGP